MGDETSSSRPKHNWSATGYLAPETTNGITFRVRANGRDVFGNAKQVEWRSLTTMVIVEYDV
jgi:hypothetical protein